MDDRLDNKPPEQSGSGDMPLLAASAAAHMMGDILARLSGPHAGAATRPLHPRELWQQIARRVGASPQPGTTGAVQPSPDRISPSHFDLIWRARRRQTSKAGEGATDRELSDRPRAVTRPSVNIPALSHPPAYTGEPERETVTPPAESAISAPQGIQGAQEGHTSSEIPESQPSVFIPPKVVQIEYIPGPAVQPPAPLVAPRLPVQEPSKGLQASVSRTLSAEINQDFVIPTTDLLSRMTYAYELELSPTAPRPIPAAPSQPSEAETVATQQPSAPTQSEPTEVVAATLAPAPQAQAPLLAMPLTPPPSMRKARETRSEGGRIAPSEQKGLVARLLDRVRTTLPILEPSSSGQRLAEPRDQAVSVPPATPGSAPGSATPAAPPSLVPPVQPTLSEPLALPQVSPQPARQPEANDTRPFIVAEQPSRGPIGIFFSRVFGEERGIEPDADPASVSMPLAHRESRQQGVEPLSLPPLTVSQPPSQQTRPVRPATPAPATLSNAQVAIPMQASPAELPVALPRTAPEQPLVQIENAPLPVAADVSAPQPLLATQADAQSHPQMQPYMGVESTSPGFFGSVFGRALGSDATTSPERRTEGSQPLALPWVRRDRTRLAPNEQASLPTAMPRSAALPTPTVTESAPSIAPGAVSVQATPDREAMQSVQERIEAQEVPQLQEASTQVDTAEVRAQESSPLVAQETPASAAPGVQIVQEQERNSSPTPLEMPQTTHTLRRPGIDESGEYREPVEENKKARADLLPAPVVASQPSVADVATTQHSIVEQSPTPSETVARAEPVQPVLLPEQTAYQQKQQPDTPMEPEAVPQVGTAQPPVPAQAEASSTEQTWQAIAQIADEVVGSHTPRITSEPGGGSSPSGRSFLDRIFRRQRGTSRPPEDTPTALSEMASGEYRVPAQATESQGDAQSGQAVTPEPQPLSDIATTQYHVVEQPPAMVETITEPVQPVLLPEKTVQPSAPAQADATSTTQQPVEYSEQTWEAIAQMADEVVRSHAPLMPSEPTGGSSPQSRSFLDRIFRRQERAFRPSGSTPAALSDSPFAEGNSSPAGNLELRLAPALIRRLTQPRVEHGGLTSRSSGGIGLPQADLTPTSQAAAQDSAALSQGPTADASVRIHFTPAALSTGQPIQTQHASSVIRPLSHMSQTLGDYPGSDPVESGDTAIDGVGESDEYMSLLQQYYGREAEESPNLPNLPLAHPYGTFATPNNWQSRTADSTPSRPQQNAWGRTSFPPDGSMASYEVPPEAYQSGNGYQSEDGYIGTITDMHWGGASQNGRAAGDSSSGEAGAWANVVSSAVSNNSGGTPALALAGEERPAPTEQPSEQQEAHDSAGKNQQQQLEQLADSVLTIIRHKLQIERERSW